MFRYEKRLQYPVKITRPNPKMAQVIISQFGGAKCPWRGIQVDKQRRNR